MKKINKEYLTMCLGVVCILVSNYMHLVLNLNLILCMSVLIVYSLSFTMRNITKRMDNMEAKKNLMVYLFVMAVMYISLYGLMMENHYDGFSDLAYLCSSFMVIMYSIINSLIIIKKPHASYYKVVACISTLSICFVVTLGLETFWALFAAIPLMSVFTIYNDKKLRIILCVFINIFNLIDCVRQLSIVYQWDEYHTLWYILEIFAVIIFTLSFLKTSKIIDKINNDNLSTVENKKQNTLNVSNKAINIGRDIQENVYATMKLINDIDESTHDSLTIFKEIANGNISNVESIEQQSKMISAIQKMISKVSIAANEAAHSTKIAEETLEKNMESFSNIRNMSNNIVSTNVELINVFDTFLVSVNKLKNIINGISDISEQTSLLSLNASIESVKSKIQGKAFSVVAASVKTLSDQTTELTNEIYKMVNLLDANTKNVQKVIFNIVEDLNTENSTIDSTTTDFEKIEQHINNLEACVISIKEKLTNVENFSTTIEAHISQLAASSEEVSACTEEGVNITKTNSAKARQTSSTMKEVIDVVDELKDYIVV